LINAYILQIEQHITIIGIEKVLLLYIFHHCRLNMVETRGKHGRTVAIILTPEITNGINLLNSLRSTVGIHEENPYAFARVNRYSLEHLRGWDSLRYCATKCSPKLQNPDAITSTRLRKYIATITQVLSLEEKELDWLARHLGHDIRIHREYTIGSTSQRSRLLKSASFC
jgi:hypothetical protein